MGLAIKNDSDTLECYINQNGDAVINLQSSELECFGGVFVFETVGDLITFRNVIEEVINRFENE